MTNPLRRTAPAAVTALLCAGLVAGCGTNNTDASSTPTPTPTAPAPPVTTPTSTATTSPSTTGISDGSGSYLLYFVTKTPLGDRITAETTTLTGRPSLTAVEGRSPVDPDYHNLVPAASLGAAAVTPSSDITITLSSPRFASLPAGMTATNAKLAIQQVVYSANSLAHTASKPLPVHFVLNGKDSTFLGQPSTAKPGKQLQTLSLMSVLSPIDGSTLPAAKSTFSGVGSSFEATVGWKITDSSGKSVLHGTTTSSGWMDKLYPWNVTVDLSRLPAGSYTFTASTDDASEGEGGGPIIDTKAFTIT